MAASEFFRRWSRRRPQDDAGLPKGTDAGLELEPAPESPGTAATETAPDAAGHVLEKPVPAPPALPTLEDAALLTPEGNFIPFMADGVDDAVRRAALKKLFTDPQFNIMDGLDIYVGDYSNMETMPESMLRQLNHARDLLDPLGTLERAAQSVERERQANLALERANAGASASDAETPAPPPLVEAPLEDEVLLSDEALVPVEALLSAAQAAIGGQPGETAMAGETTPATVPPARLASGDIAASDPSGILNTSRENADPAGSGSGSSSGSDAATRGPLP
jgi:hypothetical protein